MMQTDAIPYGDLSRKSKTKHEFNVWPYPNDDGDIEIAVSCSCGFHAAPVESAEKAEELRTAHYQPGFRKEAVVEEKLYTSRGHEVVVKMSDDEAMKVLLELTRSNFAQDLAKGYAKYGSWTDGQRPWAHKLANESLEPKPDRKSAAEFGGLVDLMQTAAQSLKRPKVTFDWDGRTVQLSISGPRARKPGSLNVTDGGPYGDSTWYGRILVDADDRGKFDPGRAVEDWVLDALRALNDDPVEAAASHGRRTGNCCFCNREIITNESLAVGYGPICAERYGLPWG